jgi:hypothetical protein
MRFIQLKEEEGFGKMLPIIGKYAVVDHPIAFFFDPFSC